VEANQSVEVRAQVAGTITGQYFVEGQEVRASDLLLSIDPRPFQAELEKAKGELAENLASLQQAQETVERYKPLIKDEYVSQLDYDRYVTDVCRNEGVVQQSRAAVEEAEINLDYCLIKAPFNSVTSKLAINVGNFVPVGGEPLMTLQQISPIRVSFFVPEKDLPRIISLQGQNRLTTMVIRSHECIAGELFLINNKVDEQTGTILLQAIFPNTDKKLWPGEFVDVRLILETQKNAILVPSQVVQMGQQGSYLYVVRPDSTVELRNVKVGQKEKEAVIIESGLSPGETVVLEGQLNLFPGVKVTIQ
jgi:multidrug efflux system membrane fusion protein